MKKISHLLLWIVIGFMAFSFVGVQATMITTFGGGQYLITEHRTTHELSYDVTHLTDIGQSGLASASDPQVVNILDIPNLNQVSIVPWSKLGTSRWNMTTLTSMAEDFEIDNPGYRVIAGINGDFFDISGNENLRYATVGVHAALGHIYKSTNTPSATRNPIGFKNDGSLKPIIGNVPYEKTDKMILSIYNVQDEIIDEFMIDCVNQVPGALETAIYYANWNENNEIVPILAPQGYVLRNPSYALAFSSTDFYGFGQISHMESKLLEEGEFSIVTENPTLHEILQIGVKIRVQYEFSGAFAGVENVTGAGEPIIYDGQFQADTTTFGMARHPRTMIGSKADGSLVMCVVDGRQSGMTGVSQPEMAAIMKHYGCVDAYNLDGGGSSTMIILQNGEFEVTNSPSDGRERSDSNCLLVVVKVPEIQYELSMITDHSLTLDIEVTDYNGYQFDDLYVKMNDKYQQVQEGTVTFDYLQSNTAYMFSFYTIENEQYKEFIIQDVGLTAKKLPTIDWIQLIYKDDNLEIYVQFNDPDNALERKKVTIGEDFKNMTTNVALFYQFDGKLSPFVVSYSYNLNDGDGRVDVNVEHLSLQCSIDIFMRMAKDMLTNELEQIAFS
ncbi:MAG: phosphodiester glycosidase family protein [Bacilli bacterium]